MELNSLGRRIQVLRESNMMTKGDLAQQVGVTRKDIVDWEEGRVLPTAEQVVEIARYFSADPRSLLDVMDGESVDAVAADAVPTTTGGKRFVLGILCLILGLCFMLGALYLVQTLGGDQSSSAASSSVQQSQPLPLPDYLPLTAAKIAQWDLDSDGEKEMVILEDEVLLLRKEGDNYIAYTLAQPLEKGWTLTAQDGVFLLKNAAGESRIYSVLRDGALYPAG